MRHRRPSAGLGLLVAAAAMLGAGAMPASRPTLPDVPRTPDPEPIPADVKLSRAERRRQMRAAKRRPTPTPGGTDGRE